MSYTLRDLPLPVKVVVSVFLLAVGVGYGSAMVQLHMQDSKSGKPMPTIADVIKKYTGKIEYDPNNPPPQPMGTFEKLVSAPRTASWGGNGTMSPAFFDKDGGEWKKACDANPADTARIQGEREGEQAVAILWAQSTPDARKKAYEEDKFAPAGAEKAPKAITPRFKHADGSFKIKSIIDARCARCHMKGGDPDQYPLETYAQIEGKYLSDPTKCALPSHGYIRVEEPVGITKLTQSTHAHLLSFAVLFSLTGLIFAFSSWHPFIRCVLGPWVVLAVFADVSLWWLARLCDEWGPFFAMGIVGTGGLAGGGLFAQIVLSLFNMYGKKGKVILFLMFAAGAGLMIALWVNRIDPALKDKEAQKQQQAQQPPKPPEQPPKKPDDKQPNPIDKKVNNGDDKYPLPPLSPVEKLLAFPVKVDGKRLEFKEIAWTGGDDGNMSRAFFDKEKHFKEVWENAMIPQAEKDKLLAEREGELRAIVEWMRSKEPARKAAYEADGFPLPADLGRPVTSKYLKDGKVQVKTIIADRCLKCHGEGGKQYDEYPLDTYELLAKRLEPFPAVKAPEPSPKPQDPVVAPPAKAADPIPPAKDD